MALPCVRLGAVRLWPAPITRHLWIFPRADLSTAALPRSALNSPGNVRNSLGLCSVVPRSTRAYCMSAMTKPSPVFGNLTSTNYSSILQRVTPLLPSILQQPTRSLTYFGVRSGKRKSVKAVPKRFMRLHCGLWIRKKAGYKKKLWKKMAARKKRLREVVFCNKTQSKLLDKMTTSFWKRRNWYSDDPYQKYHDRTNLKV
ncbi:large ribosomal subunit protein bL35m [Pelobates fuscus]|uniref:large ribosomal subunit protein bL35m n=1 Tax=Pelobates fuscus TaxID=191477 RepID=UPI002FE4F85E